MKVFDALITFASWEERFHFGIEKSLERYSTKKLFMYYYKQFSDWTNINRANIKNLCKKKNIKFNAMEISVKTPAETWSIYDNEFSNTFWKNKDVLVDITTMPRDSIWSIFYFLEKANARVTYIYYKPHGYNKEWLSQEPDKPRLLFKHSGIAKLGLPIGLIIVTGFDPDRTLQLINFYEPQVTVLGYQIGSQFNSNKKNLEAHKLRLKGQRAINKFTLDAYSDDHGQLRIEKEIMKYKGDYNIIMSSLGPKPSAVALYKACKKYPETALAYAPSKLFNIDYSHGIDDGPPIEGVL